MPVKKKRKKLDPNFISLQKWEIQYVANKFEILPEEVRAIVKKIGKSRKKVYKHIRQTL